MSDRRRRKFTPLGDLLDGVLEQTLPEDRGLRVELATEAFLRVAGPVVAGRCRILGLDGDTLRVAVDMPRWQLQLERMAGEYLQRVNGFLLPPLRLSAIRFLVRPSAGSPQKKREP